MVDRPLFFSVLALLLISIIMSFSLGVYLALANEYVYYHFVLRQSIAVFLGLFAMVVISKLSTRYFFVPLGMFLFFGFFILLFMMQFLSPPFVQEIGGAKRWIDVGPVNVAPVEFFKVGFVFFLAWSFTRKFSGQHNMSFKEELFAFAPYLIVFFIAVVLIAVLQKDLGQIAVLGATLLILFLLVGSSLRFFFTLVGSAFGTLTLLILIAPHRLVRIRDWWGGVQDTILSIMPFEAVQSLRIEGAREPYQVYNSLNAIFHGGYTGQGLGNGQFKLGYLPDVHSDFVLAGIAEELGFLGVLFVTVLLLFVVYRIFFLASKMKESSHYLFSVGIGLLIGFTFLLNAFGISGMTPIKGIAVPFLSYGGSHILASSIAIGLILMISKSIPTDKQGRYL